MNPVMIRAKLGIPLHGPYSRNRRRRHRRPLREFSYLALAVTVALVIAAILTAPFFI